MGDLKKMAELQNLEQPIRDLGKTAKRIQDGADRNKKITDRFLKLSKVDVTKISTNGMYANFSLFVRSAYLSTMTT